MEFFKRFKPNVENKNPEKPTLVETEKYMDKVVDDQKSFRIEPELSIEDYNDEISRKTDFGSKNIDAGFSWEEIAQGQIILERFSKLSLKYNEVAQEVRKKNSDLEELKMTRSGVREAVKRLNLKELVSKEINTEVISHMRNAEDRLERLEKKIKQNEIEMMPAFQELNEISKELEMLAGLLPDEQVGDDGEIKPSSYDFTQN